MNFETAKKIIDFVKLKSNETQTISIVFFGGEPLLNFNLLKDTVVYAKATLNNRILDFNLTTNAINLNEEIILFFKEHKIYPLFSLDGGEYETNLLRKSPNGINVFKTAINNIHKYISITGMNPNVRVTMTKKNLNKAEIADKLYSEGFHNVIISPCSPYQERNDINLSLDDIDKYKINHEKYFTLIYEKFKAKQKFMFGKLERYYNLISNRNRILNSCSAGTCSIYVFANGDVYPCDRFNTSNQNANKYYMGNIHDRNINIDNFQFNIQKTLFVNNRSNCKTCWCKYLCGGECPGDSLIKGNINDIFEVRCEVFKTEILSAIHLYILNYLNNLPT